MDEENLKCAGLLRKMVLAQQLAGERLSSAVHLQKRV
jgi:hypothetical protein